MIYTCPVCFVTKNSEEDDDIEMVTTSFLLIYHVIIIYVKHVMLSGILKNVILNVLYVDKKLLYLLIWNLKSHL